MDVCDITGDCGQGRSRKAGALTRETEVESSMPNFLYVTGCLNISSPNGFLCHVVRTRPWDRIDPVYPPQRPWSEAQSQRRAVTPRSFKDGLMTLPHYR